MKTLFALIALSITLGCTKAEPKVKTPAFLPPTAEQAYRMQADCSRLGEKILQENLIGIALTHTVVARYNPTTNRCYALLSVYEADLEKLSEYNKTYFYDGQTDELLAWYGVDHGRHPFSPIIGDCISNNETNRPEGDALATRLAACVADRIASCMAGKACEVGN